MESKAIDHINPTFIIIRQKSIVTVSIYYQTQNLEF